MADAFAQDERGDPGSQRLWHKVVDDGLISAGLEPGTPLHETQRVLRFSHLSNLHGGDVLKPWEDAHKEGRFVDFKNPESCLDESFFVTRVLSTPFVRSPAGGWSSEWQEQRANIDARTLQGGYWSAATSASLNQLDDTKFFVDSNADVCGQILDIPPCNILVSSESDLCATLPPWFYRKHTDDVWWNSDAVGRRFLKTINSGIKSPNDTMQKGRTSWNEIYYAPVNSDNGLSSVSTSALFVVTDEKDPNRWSGKHGLIYQTARANNLPLVRFSSDS